MPQIDLVTYASILQFLYVLFWVYFVIMVLVSNNLFKFKAVSVLNNFKIVLPVSVLYWLGVSF